MRRGPGISGIQRAQQAQIAMKSKGSEIHQAELSQMKDQMEKFHTNLEEFAKKYKKDINRNPEFRKHFQDMCTKIGVDPLASNKGFWSEMLGVGDFYYELGVQIIQICLKTRSKNGGIIDAAELTKHLTELRGKHSQPISIDDIERATKKLKVLGSGFEVLTVGSRKMIQSVPCELNTDHTTVLVLAQKSGWVNASVIKKELGWTNERIDAVLDLLIRESMAWLDLQHESGEPTYWFLSLAGGSLQESN
jgi:ESCRT-II complex subunit VPS22